MPHPRPIVSALALLLSAVAAAPAPAQNMDLVDDRPVDVWLDVDTSTGVTRERPRDVDDGLAMIYAFRSPEIRVVGVSVVYGNADLDEAVPIAEDVIERFGPEGLVAHPGAAGPGELGVENDATRALADALRARPDGDPLTVLPLGPFTNVATVLKNHPELAGKVKELVVVAARRPGFRFSPPGRPEVVFPDANMEKDAPATQILLDSGVPIAFAGYESSSDLWLTRADLDAMRATGGASGEWVAETSDYWLSLWEQRLGLPGFNPFDTVAVAWVTHPDLVESVPASAHLTVGPDDRLTPETRQQAVAAGAPTTKPYLVAEPPYDVARAADAPHAYLTGVRPGLKPIVVERLAGE